MSIAVSIKSLSKCFRLFSSPKDRVKEWLHPFRKRYHRKFWALKNISFDIKKGETIGIIGQNGSGKSTLLQIITSVMFPTSGDIITNGKIAALLELGAGFDHELTGRENLFINGSIMGLTKKEIKERIPQIEDFADIGKFIDQPVKLYSSGMFVRLAFSAAIHVDPEILIVDEALAVGDVKFQNKCYRKFYEFKKKGKTVIFVTHSTDLVAKHCDRAILLHNGQLVKDGKPNPVINAYLEILLGTSEEGKLNKDKSDRETLDLGPQEVTDVFISADLIVERFTQDKSPKDLCALNPTYNKNEYRYGNGKGSLINYLVLYEKTINPIQIKSFNSIQIFAKYHFKEHIETPVYGLTLKTVDGVEVFGSNSLAELMQVRSTKKGDISIVKYILPMNLKSGDYFFSLGLAESIYGEIQPLDRRYDLIHLNVFNKNSRFGIVDFEFQLCEIN